MLTDLINSTTHAGPGYKESAVGIQRRQWYLYILRGLFSRFLAKFLIWAYEQRKQILKLLLSEIDTELKSMPNKSLRLARTDCPFPTILQLPDLGRENQAWEQWQESGPGTGCPSPPVTSITRGQRLNRR